MRNLLRLILLALAGVAAWSLLSAEGRQRPPARRPEGRPEPESPSEAPTGERRCQGITYSGERCRRVAEPGSDYCWQHGG